MSENLKVIKSLPLLHLPVLSLPQCSFHLNQSINLTFFPFSYIWCTICSLADNPELPHLSYLLACKDALVLAPIPLNVGLNVGLNYVQEKSSGCLPSLLHHGGKFKDILLHSLQLLLLTTHVPYMAFHLCI